MSDLFVRGGEKACRSSINADQALFHRGDIYCQDLRPFILPLHLSANIDKCKHTSRKWSRFPFSSLKKHINDGIGCHNERNSRCDHTQHTKVIRESSAEEMHKRNTQYKSPECAADHRPECLLTAIEVSIKDKYKRDCYIIITARAEVRDSGFYHVSAAKRKENR